MAEQPKINIYTINNGRVSLKDTLSIVDSKTVNVTFVKVIEAGKKTNFFELRDSMNSPLFITDQDGFTNLIGGGDNKIQTYDIFGGRVVVPEEELLFVGSIMNNGFLFPLAKEITIKRPRAKGVKFYQMRTQNNVPVITVDSKGYSILGGL